MFKPVKLLGIALLIVGAIQAQSTWQPSPGHKQIPIWSGQIPDARKMDGPEVVETTVPPDLVAGRPYLSVERVAVPTMTVYEPKDKQTGTAIIVFPGGGYENRISATPSRRRRRFQGDFIGSVLWSGWKC